MRPSSERQHGSLLDAPHPVVMHSTGSLSQPMQNGGSLIRHVLSLPLTDP